MSIFKVNKTKAANNNRKSRKKKEYDEDDKGILYILVFEIDCKEIYKIGITRRANIEDRVLEILEAFFKQYRYFPKCTPKRFSKVKNVLVSEQEMHAYFSDYKYEFDKKFGGSTEFFSDIPLDSILEKYDEIKARK